MPFGSAKVATTETLIFGISALRLTSRVSALIRIDRASVIGSSRNELTVSAAARSFAFQQSACHSRALMRALLHERACHPSLARVDEQRLRQLRQRWNMRYAHPGCTGVSDYQEGQKWLLDSVGMKRNCARKTAACRPRSAYRIIACDWWGQMTRDF